MSGLQTDSPISVDSATLSTAVSAAVMNTTANEQKIGLTILIAAITVCLSVAAIVGAFIIVILRDGNTTEVSDAMHSLTIIGSTGFGALVVMVIGKSALNNVLGKLVG